MKANRASYAATNRTMGRFPNKDISSARFRHERHPGIPIGATVRVERSPVMHHQGAVGVVAGYRDGQIGVRFGNDDRTIWFHRRDVRPTGVE